MPANKAKSKQIKDLISKHPEANIPTEITKANEAFYTMLGLKLVKTKGVGTMLKCRAFTIDPMQWESSSDEKKKAQYFGFEELVILHDPNVGSKDKEETV